MGTNGVHKPVIGYKNGKLIGTKRLYTDGKFKGKDGRAKFMATDWRGLQVAGREQQEKYALLINNGRNNLVWQNAFYDIHTPFVRERIPVAPIEMNPDDMKRLDIDAGDLVEVYNDVGSTQAMLYPTPTEKPGRAFMLFIAPTGQVGNVISKGTNELMIPNYKNVWANIRRIGHTPGAGGVSFKSIEYPKHLSTGIARRPAAGRSSAPPPFPACMVGRTKRPSVAWPLEATDASRFDEHNLAIPALDPPSPFQGGQRPVDRLVRQPDLGGDLRPGPVEQQRRRIARRLETKPGEYQIRSRPDVAKFQPGPQVADMRGKSTRQCQGCAGVALQSV
jgi:formylmethanofuran dehydrogenase subunit D